MRREGGGVPSLWGLRYRRVASGGRAGGGSARGRGRLKAAEKRNRGISGAIRAKMRVRAEMGLLLESL